MTTLCFRNDSVAGLSDILSVKDRLPAAMPAATPAAPPPSHPPKNAPKRQATAKNPPTRTFGGNKGEDSGLDHFSDSEIGKNDNFIYYFSSLSKNFSNLFQHVESIIAELIKISISRVCA